jgi:hypothetical protein
MLVGNTYSTAPRRIAVVERGTPSVAPPVASSASSRSTFVNPVDRVGHETGMALLRYRDAEQGEARGRYPPDKAAGQYREIGAADP